LIGAELVRSLRRAGHDVVSLDLKTGCDLRRVDEEPFRATERVWFLAWDVGGAKYLGAAERQHAIYRNNCELSARVFDALARTGRPFLFVTSQLAGLPDAYGLTKLLAEKWAEQLGGKVARLWNIYGWENPNLRSHVITDFVLSGLTAGHVRCLTSGRERRRFLYKSDCVAALMSLFDGPQRSADVAGPEWLPVRYVAEETARQLAVPVVLGERDGPEVLADPENLLPGWRPVITLAEGLSRVIAEARALLGKPRLVEEVA
jgi:nucleoside-diphosphate-sugar epimerase